MTPTDTTTNLPPVFCAIDTTDIDHGMALAAAMQRAGCGIKIGLEFFNSCGPNAVKEMQRDYSDLQLFLDLKFHDIPNTVAGAVRAVSPLQPAYLNVHASGGLEMMKAAKETSAEEADKGGFAPPRILGVTVLTSLDDDALSDIGYGDNMSDQVLRLAELTQKAGLDGVVCSAHEIEKLRSACGGDFVLMVPGIRPEGADTQDQKRVMTPKQAMQAGATHLVIGRPISRAEQPHKAATDILASLGNNGPDSAAA